MNLSTASQLDFINSIHSAPKCETPRDVRIPFFYAYNDHLTICPRPDYRFRKKEMHENSLKNLDEEQFKGKVSDAAERKIRSRITAWLKSIVIYNDSPGNRFKRKEHYPIFITLTLSDKQSHPDNFIKRHLLGEFLKNVKRNHDIINYFWRAERQENGNIHFHILTDRYIDKLKIQKIWNKIQDNHGYLYNYKKQYHNDQPPSTHVKSAKDVENFLNYSLKYMIKEEENSIIDGRIWGLSDSIRDLKTYNSVLNNKLNDAIDQAVNLNLVRIYRGDYFTSIYFEKDFKDCALDKLLNDYARDYYLNIYNDLYLKPPDLVPIVKPPIKLKPKLLEPLTLDLDFDILRANFFI